MKTSKEFVVGKHGIGWVDSDFEKEYKDKEFSVGTLLPFKKLERSMTDSEIIKEFNVQESTLGDVIAFLDDATEEMKDGYANIFYIKGHPSRVVYVGWYDGKWLVGAWIRFGYWSGGSRVFSPATSDTDDIGTKSSETLELGAYCECERCPKCNKLIK